MAAAKKSPELRTFYPIVTPKRKRPRTKRGRPWGYGGYVFLGEEDDLVVHR